MTAQDSQFAGWVGAGVLVAICGLLIVIASTGELGLDLLRYERTSLQQGEWWRLISAHAVHLGWGHLLLNLFGLGLMFLLFARAFGPLGWAAIIVASMAGVDAGLWFLEPQLQWYVGLSGVLHGVFAAGLIGRWRQRAPEMWLLALLLTAKLIWEQWAGALPTGVTDSGGQAIPVIVNAHLYGAIGAALLAAPAAILRRFQPTG